jgi:hypothetical protein
MNNYYRRYWKNHPKKSHEFQERYRKSQRLICLIHYGGDPPKCVCCGETNILFLTIDHINSSGTEQRRNIGWGTVFYTWLIKNNFPEGYQIMCWNCNCGKQMNHGICPHKVVK